MVEQCITNGPLVQIYLKQSHHVSSLVPWISMILAFWKSVSGYEYSIVTNDL